MEKLIIIHPLDSKHKAMFEKLNSVFFFEYEIWRTYRDKYHFDFDYYIQHLKWSNLYTDVPETIELSKDREWISLAIQNMEILQNWIY